jgi:hypothetical protein
MVVRDWIVVSEEGQSKGRLEEESYGILQQQPVFLRAEDLASLFPEGG